MEAPMDRSNLMIFMSDGMPNVPGDGDNEEATAPIEGNNPNSLMFNSELAVLDNLGVKRICIGVGAASDVRDGFGLSLIDNTPDLVTGERAEQVLSTTALQEAVLQNPIIGEDITDFSISVNGVKSPLFGVANVVSGPFGYTFTDLVVPDLDPVFWVRPMISMLK